MYCHTSTPSNAVEYQAAFDGLRSANTAGWIASDGGLPVDLADGRVIWLFGDTLIGSPPTLRDFANNAFIVQTGACFRPMIEPIPDPAPGEFVWPRGAVEQGNRLLVVGTHMRKGGTPPFDFELVNMEVAVFSLPGLTLQSVTDLPLPISPTYGEDLLVQGQYVYAYGETREPVANNFPTPRHYVARAPVGDVLDTSAWRYWQNVPAGQDPWASSSAEDAEPMLFDNSETDGPLAGLSVGFNGSYVGSAFPIDVFSTDTIVTWIGAGPGGPWTRRPIPALTGVDTWYGQLGYPTRFAYGGRVVFNIAGSPIVQWSTNHESLDATLMDPNFYKVWFATPLPGSVPLHDPFGSLDAAQGSPGSVSVAGWTIDPDTAAPITVHVYVDGQGFVMGPASLARADVGAAYPTYGPNHGFNAQINGITPGPHTVCAYGINTGAGQNKTLGCRSVAVPSGTPFGSLDAAQGSPGSVSVAGWTIDPDTAAPITVHVYVDGQGFVMGPASLARADVGAAYPTYGPNHGFNAQINGITPGPHTVCAYGINTGAGQNKTLGCRSVAVPSGTPFGSLDAAQGSPGSVSVAGWTIDPDTAAPITVHVYVDGQGFVMGPASLARADVGAAYPTYGPNHGFNAQINGITPGPHTVCAYGINTGAGQNKTLGCRSVAVPSGTPFGSLDAAQGSPGSVSVAGWTIDPDTAAPITVHVYVDGQGFVMGPASLARADVGAAYPTYGPNHGFNAQINGITPGPHTVCAYGINTGAGQNKTLGCTTAAVR